MVNALMLNWLSEEGKSFVRSRSPKEDIDWIRAITEWDACKREQAYRPRPYERTQDIRRGEPYRGFETIIMGMESEANENQFVEDSYGRRNFDVKRTEPKPVIKREQLQPTCFTCGVKGHKSPDCPKMVKRAVKAVRIDQSPSLLTELEVKVAGKECIFTLDSGANITVVASDLVDGAVYTSKTVALFDFDSVVKGSYPMADVWCHVSNHSFLVQAAVSESLQGEVLLVRDVPGSIFLPLLNEAQTSNIRVNETRLQERRRLASQQSADRRGKRDYTGSRLSCSCSTFAYRRVSGF